LILLFLFFATVEERLRRKLLGVAPTLVR